MENIPMKSGVPAFKTESLAGKNVEIKYKSGGRYKGELVNNKKNGKGEMYWPDGAAYHGDFVNDLRSGYGRQFYRDESSYDGHFVNNKRCGYGIQKFSNGEIYEGDFFQDLCHGSGKYIWPNKCEFVGLFYANKKEGYGTSKFGNGNVFQGLYNDDKREGPGILTYNDTALQDVGLWYGLRLIRISCQLPMLFSLSQFPHYQYFKPKPPVITAADTWNTHSLLRDLSNICDYSNDLSEKIKDIYLEYPDSCNVKVNYELFNKVYIQQFFGFVDMQRTSKLWNITPALEDLQKHVLKHSFNQTLINVDDILKYNRNCFYPEGPHENISEQLLWASAFGKNEIVENILKEDIIHPDVAGKDGNTALINATAIGNCGIINSLLNHGANVNQLNDEGCSALSAGFVLCYPAESLHMNLLCDTCCHLPSATTDIEENAGSESTSSQVMAAGDNGYPLMNPQSTPPVQVDRTSSMELESLDEILNSTPQNALPADDVDSGISRSSQICHEKLQSRISLNRFDRQRSGMRGSIFPNASIPPQNSLLKSRVKTSGYGRQSIFEMRQGYSYLNPVNAATKQTENKTMLESKMDLPNIQNEGMAKERFLTPSPSSLSARPLLLHRSSWWNNYRVSDWMDATNLEKENTRRKMLQIPFQDNRGKDDTEDFPRKCIKSLSRGFLPVENPELPTKGVPSQSHDREKLFAPRKTCFQECVEFLLKRGANPNSSSCPWPVLFIATRALDVPMVKTLLLKGAFASASLSKEEKSLFPLHLSCSFPGKEGYQITELLLNSLADPDARIALDNSYLESLQMSESQGGSNLEKAIWTLTGGRTPLHIACGHEDNHQEAARIVRLLLENRANHNLLCNGISPLAVAIAYGNVPAVEELLGHGADPSLPLAHGVGSALCMCVLSHFKGQLSAYTTVQLLNKLYKASANVLAKIPIGPKKILGTVVDFSYDLFYQDQRISRIPPHALTLAERETYKMRKEILVHIGSLLRETVIEQQINRESRQETKGSHSKSKFIFTVLHQGKTKKSSESRSVTFDFSDTKHRKSAISPEKDPDKNWSLHDLCYECGRTVNVKLKPCTRCKEVSFCSKSCKIKAWTTRHRNECLRIKDKKSFVKGHRRESAPNVSSHNATSKTDSRGAKSIVNNEADNARSRTENYSFG